MIPAIEIIPTATRNRSVWLRVGTVIDGSDAQPTHQVNVVYDDRQFLFMGEESPPAELLKPARRQPDCELPQHTLLPGLIEAHAHLFLEGGELDSHKRAEYLKQRSEALLKAARSRLEKLVRLGITAVRDAGDKDGIGLALSRLYRSVNRPLMPYLDSPGSAIHHRGRYGSFMAEPIEDFVSIRECVEARIKEGADRIKLIPTGIINFRQGSVTTEPQMTTAEVLEAVAAAKRSGKQTFAHASGDDGIERAIEGGVDSIEHGFFIREDQLSRMRDRNIAWVPTFAPVQQQVTHADRMGWDGNVVSNLKRILDQHAANLVRAHAMGVKIIAGSDAGSYAVPHGTGFLAEMELMESAGLPALAVIHSATGASSARLAFTEKFGLIRPGYLCRFILTRHSPLENISNLNREKIVVFDGSVFETGDASQFQGL